MAQYKVDRKCYIGDKMYDNGDVVTLPDYVEPMDWMEKVDVESEQPKKRSRKTKQEPKDGDIVSL